MTIVPCSVVRNHHSGRVCALVRVSLSEVFLREMLVDFKPVKVLLLSVKGFCLKLLTVRPTIHRMRSSSENRLFSELGPLRLVA